METKTIMFVKAWMEPLRQLSPEQRWNLMEAIMEYDSTGETPEQLSDMENLAFTFIRAEIDRMKTRYREVCDKRRNAANSSWTKTKSVSDAASGTPEDEYAVCNCIQGDANDYNIKEETEEETETENKTKTERRLRRSSRRSSKNKSTSASSTSPTYDDSMVLDMFFSPENAGRVAAIAKIHNLPETEIRRMAEEITTFWALTDKTHSTYKDASAHLIFSIEDQVERERRNTKISG
ncbi:MAG: hypothetical protein K2I92_07700 [Muribaculaceae bacterium]|nr:hypothetical protein [Muribaculaceae bacterium]